MAIEPGSNAAREIMTKTEVIGKIFMKGMDLLASGKPATGMLLWGCPISFFGTVIGIWTNYLDSDKVENLGVTMEYYFPYFLSCVLPVSIGMLVQKVGPEIAMRIAEMMVSLRRKK